MLRVDPSDFNQKEEEEDNELVRLSLCTGSTSQLPTTQTQTQTPPPSLVNVPIYSPELYNSTPVLAPGAPVQESPAPSCTRRKRRSSAQTLKQGKTLAIPPPYPWATTWRAKVHTYAYLMENNLSVISGEVQCRRCDKNDEINYDLQDKFMEITAFIERRRYELHQRAPRVWMNPILPACRFCNQENCVKPVIKKKQSINWLFLLLGQMLGCCKLNELKYFCKHTKNHRTGAKDRLLFLTYFTLCRQLNPDGPFYIR